MRVALPTAAALGAGAAVAIGSIPGSGGVITGCFNTVPGSTSAWGAPAPYGALRVIDPAQTGVVGNTPPQVYSCVSGENTITWNSSGPQGPTGPQGPAGPGGGQGPAGPIAAPTLFTFGNGGETFLKLEGVVGEAPDKNHAGQIQISSFSIGGQGTQAHGSGGGAGKVRFGEFTITKPVDKASPKLLLGSAQGVHYKEAVVSFAHKHKGSETDYLQYKFNDILISSYQAGGHGHSDLVPTEMVTFNFATAQTTFFTGGGKGNTQKKLSLNITPVSSG